MIAQASPILVRPFTSRLEFDKRQSERHECGLDTTTQPLDSADMVAWGANIRDISRTGVGLTLCYPFRAGTYLAVNLKGTQVLSRVVHVRDRADGTWHVGCEFVKPLTDDEVDLLR
jgi:hypothetical protein